MLARSRLPREEGVRRLLLLGGLTRGVVAVSLGRRVRGREQHRDAAAAIAMTKSANTAAETTAVTHRGRGMRHRRRFVAAEGASSWLLRGESSLVGRSEHFVTVANRRFVTRRFS